MNPGICSPEFGTTWVSQQYLVGALPTRLEEVFMEVSFLVNKVSRLSSVGLGVAISLECNGRRLLYQSMVVLNRSN